MLQLPTWFDPLTGGEGGSPEFQTQSNNPFSMKFLPYFEGRITLLMSFLAIWKNRQAWLRGKSLVIENTIRNRLLVFTLSFPSVLMSFSWALHCTELAEAHSSTCVCVCACVCVCVCWWWRRQRQAGAIQSPACETSTSPRWNWQICFWCSNQSLPANHLKLFLHITKTVHWWGKKSARMVIWVMETNSFKARKMATKNTVAGTNSLVGENRRKKECSENTVFISLF